MTGLIGRWVSGVVFAGAWLFASAALAVGEDVFVVPRVPVQAQADNASAAKAAAQSMGRRRAMDILLRRLTVEEDWVYLPRLATGEPAGAAEAAAPGLDSIFSADPLGDEKRVISLTPNDLETLESGFEVYAEKSSATTYRAFITYRFKPDAVRRLLKDARLPYSETQTRTALVIPVLQTNNGLYLWEQNNPWMAAWKARPYVNELTPMTAPLGDLEDTSRITGQQALNLEPEPLAAMAEYYSVSQVIVAVARLKQVDGTDTLNVRLINGYRDSAHVPADASIETALSEIGSSDYQAAPQVEAEEIVAKVGDVLGEVAVSDVSGNFPLLAELAIERAIAKYASGWKARTLIDHSAESILETSAFFESINGWSTIRAALSATPLVGSVQVFALSPRGAEMRLKVFGDPSRLAVAMENHGVTFWSENGERWLLATPALARQLRGSRSLRERRRTFGDTEPFDPTIERASEERPAPGGDAKIEQRY